MKIICFGDSNTYGYDPRGFFGGRYDAPWPEILAGLLGCDLINRGENGREIPIRAVDFPHDADLLVVMLGTNDLLQGTSPEAVCQRMEKFLKAQDPERVLLMAPPHLKLGAWVVGQRLIEDSKALSAGYQSLAKHLGVRFIDAGAWSLPLCYDGVHLTEDGHRLLAGNLYKELTP